MNPYLYNPAYAGVEGHSVIYLLYNQKWTKIQDSPTTSHVSFHTPLRGGIGVGVTGYNVTQGLLTKSQGKLSGSYLFTIDREHHLRLGLSVGAGTQSLNFGELDDPTDPVFVGIVDQSTFLLADFGATYHFGHFNVGFSMPNLIGYDVFQENNVAGIKPKPLDNLLFKINYRGHINDNLAIEPHVIYRYSDVTQGQLEATAIFHIYHVVWAGMTFRQDNSFAITAGTKIKEMIGIGYSYELGNSSISNLLGDTHEIHIGVHLGTRKSHHAHVSSFIKSHRLTAEERAEKAAQEREARLAALQQSRNTDDEPDDDQLSIVGNQTSDTEQTDPDTSTEPEVETWEKDDQYSEVTRTNDIGVQERSVVIKHQNQDGDEEYAVAWLPADENWEYQDDEAPLTRTAADGTKEIGVRYKRTLDDGTEETVIKWEKVVPASLVQDLLSATNTTESLPDTSTDQQQQTTEDTSQVVTPIAREVETTPETIREDTVDTQITPVVDTPVTAPPETTPTTDTTLTTDFRTHDQLADSDDHLEVKRGNHLLELPAGNYVVAGAFKVFEHAENYSDDLFSKGYHDTIVGYISEREYYYVVIFRSNDLSAANGEKNKVKGRSGMEKVWVLKVSE